MSNTQQQLIEEAVERFNDWASKTTADFRSEDGEDYNVEFSQLAFYDDLKEKLKDELSLIARKSVEGERWKLLFAVQNVQDDLKNMPSKLQPFIDHYTKELSNPKEHTIEEVSHE